MGRSGQSAFKNIQEQIKVADLLFEVRDARLPKTSQHPKIKELFGNKPRLIILAKQDLADSEKLNRWLHTKAGDFTYIPLDLKLSKHKKQVIDLALKLTAEKAEAQRKRGLLPRPIRACVIGLPNVGKSSFINWLIGKRKTNVGNKPGVTRGPQWVRLHPQLELLDTPGILPMVSFDHATTLKLALCNILPSSHFDLEEVAGYGIDLVTRNKSDAFSIYGSNLDLSKITLTDLALARNSLMAGGKPDIIRAASMLINDFRSGNLGRYFFD